MTNAEWMIKNGYKFSDLCCCFDSSSGDIVISLYNKILVRRVRRGYISFNDFLKRWLDKEHEEESILSNAEKKYLSAVIKPFRDKVNYICKKDFVNFNNPEGYDVYQHIVIGIDDGPEVVLPLFKSGAMYKGMKPGHKYYTLKDLGI